MWKWSVCARATEGLYVGEEIQLTDRRPPLQSGRLHAQQSRKIAIYAFEEAKRRGYDTVVPIHKSNILKLTCGSFFGRGRKSKAGLPGNRIMALCHVDNIASATY